MSVAQLKPTTATATGALNLYRRKVNTKPPPVRNKGDEYYIERVLGKRMLQGKTYYLIKQADWGNEYNVWYVTNNLPDYQDLIKEYEVRMAIYPIPARRSQKEA